MSIKLADVSFNTIVEFTKPEQALERFKEAIGYIEFIKDLVHFSFISHINYEGEKIVNGVKYSFFKRRKDFWYIPLKTNRYIKNARPDVLLNEGLIFPLQVIAIKLTVGKKCKIIAQHHGERPFKGLKKLLQKIADRCIDKYLFTSKGNAEEWVEKGIIKNIDKCAEVLEASTYFTRKNKEESKKRLGITGDRNFLWVGRLNSNKDPMTLLSAFKNYVDINPVATLYMAYHTEELLTEVKSFIGKYPCLKESVILKGKIDHAELEYWFSAADFYISASHKEGSGYALLEAMACGCIPIVTSIPSFKKITDYGKYGFLYPNGNVDQLTETLSHLDEISIEEFSNEIEFHFKNNLSFKNIANDIYCVCKELIHK